MLGEKSTSLYFIILHYPSFMYNNRTRKTAFQRANLWPKNAHATPSYGLAESALVLELSTSPGEAPFFGSCDQAT